MGLKTDRAKEIERRERELRRSGFTGACLTRLAESKADLRQAAEMLSRGSHQNDVALRLT